MLESLAICADNVGRVNRDVKGEVFMFDLEVHTVSYFLHQLRD